MLPVNFYFFIFRWDPLPCAAHQWHKFRSKVLQIRSKCFGKKIVSRNNFLCKWTMAGVIMFHFSPKKILRRKCLKKTKYFVSNVCVVCHSGFASRKDVTKQNGESKCEWRYCAFLLQVIECLLLLPFKQQQKVAKSC